ncbi:MAG: HEPN domain-containing protein [Thermoplasmata archaeon]
MDRISARAIEESLSWLKSADLNKKGQNYSKCIYDLQMALEMAVKAILLAVGVDSPKKHNVNDLLEIAVNERKSLFSEQFKSALPEIVASLRRLLYLRSASAYGFEKSIGQTDFESISNEMYEPIADYVSICSEEVKRINNRK